MKRKFAARYIDAKRINNEKIVYEYKKQIQIMIMRRQILLKAAVDA